MKCICFILILCTNVLFAPQKEVVIHNPVLNLDFPDPAVIGVNGNYYSHALDEQWQMHEICN